MRILIFLGSLLAVIGMAYWAYQQNFETQQAQKRVRALQQESAATREALELQRAEWAHLNRPDRLQDLVNLNFEQLQLLPLAPQSFGTIAEVPTPLPQIAIGDATLEGLTDTQPTVAGPQLGEESFP